MVRNVCNNDQEHPVVVISVQNEPEVYFLVGLTLLQSYFVYEGKLANFVYHR